VVGPNGDRSCAGGARAAVEDRGLGLGVAAGGVLGPQWQGWGRLGVGGEGGAWAAVADVD
jgi:hypothetical protein